MSGIKSVNYGQRRQMMNNRKEKQYEALDKMGDSALPVSCTAMRDGPWMTRGRSPSVERER